MRKLPQKKPARELIIEAVAGGARTWDDLQALTDLSAERLGLALSELFDARRIWTGQSDGVRVYGLERRKGLKPRFRYPLRRSTDHA
jgi:hypothetical protein